MLYSKLSVIIKISLVASLGGVLFGYDTAVIAGAIGFMKTYYDLSPGMVGWVASCAILGCIIGSYVGSLISDLYGRRKALFYASILFFISSIGTSFPFNLQFFIFFRILGGIGVGIAAIVSPLYLSEISPKKFRGAIISINQFAIIFGMLLVYFVNYFIARYGQNYSELIGFNWNVEYGWRIMFGSESIPAILFFLLLFTMPESPRWLIMRNKTNEARAILNLVGGGFDVDNEIESIKKSFVKKTYGEQDKGKIYKMFFYGICLAFFQQSIGINVILYYAPEILKKISGAETNIAFLQTIIIGVVNLVFTVFSILFVDKFGRRPILIYGYLGLFISLVGLSIVSIGDFSGLVFLVFILIYVSIFAFSIGPITWVLLAEIFPNDVRAKVMGAASIVLWSTNFLISQTFPLLIESEYISLYFNDGFPFILYGVFAFLAYLFAKKYIPETKNISLEDVDKFWVR